MDPHFLQHGQNVGISDGASCSLYRSAGGGTKDQITLAFLGEHFFHWELKCVSCPCSMSLPGPEEHFQMERNLKLSRLLGSFSARETRPLHLLLPPPHSPRGGGGVKKGSGLFLLSNLIVICPVRRPLSSCWRTVLISRARYVSGTMSPKFFAPGKKYDSPKINILLFFVNALAS